MLDNPTAARGSACAARWCRRCFARSSSCCDDRLGLGHTGVVGRRRDRHAQGLRQPGVQAQTVLGKDPFSGHVFCFRGRRGDLVKLLWWDGDGLCLFAKRLERGRFVWPRAEQGLAVLTPAQLSMLLEGIDWRRPVRTSQPMLAG